MALIHNLIPFLTAKEQREGQGCREGTPQPWEGTPQPFTVYVGVGKVLPSPATFFIKVGGGSENTLALEILV